MAIIRQNTFVGVDEEAVTEANSAAGGDPFDTVDSPGVTYEADGAYEGVACLRLDAPGASNGLAWTGLGGLGDCAMRVYVKRSAAAESGNLWWSNVLGTAVLGAGGNLSYTGILLEDALPPDTWCRVEVVRSGTTATLSVWSTDPESTGPPDATDSATVATTGITQWWLEHQGSAVYYDCWAIADTDTPIGPIGLDPDPDPATIITNSCDGAEGEPVTAAESAAHGTPWGLVDPGLYYTSQSYRGRGALELSAAAEGARGVAWNQGLSLGDLAVRGYLYRPEGSGAGNLCWANALGSARLTDGGGLTWAGLALPDGTVPEEAWVRVELRREGSLGTAEVFANPTSTVPTATVSGTVTDTTVVQWWWERSGTGPIIWDELALADSGTPIGPVPGGTGENRGALFLAPGLPLFA